MWCLMNGVVGALVAASCVPVRDDGVTPPDGSDLAVIAVAASTEVFEGGLANLTAAATGGTSPYRFRWDQNDGPADVGLTDAANSATDTEPLGTVGRYVFRVVATDAAGFHATDFVAVEVLPSVSVSAPPLAIVGQAVELVAELENPESDAQFRWELERGTGTLSQPDSPATTLTTAQAETVGVVLTVTISAGDAVPVTTTRTVEIASVTTLHPRVLIETNQGDITVELDGEAAPRHTANFLFYVNDGFYDGLLFHRVVCDTGLAGGECDPFVIQAGGFRRVEGDLEEDAATRDPVPSEADNGLTNGAIYSLALALSGGDADSGTTQFFINLDEDNASLDAQGFTVFGRVVVGTAVVDAIARVPTIASPILAGEASLPEEDVIIVRMAQVLSGE